jgi:hypothetical protein
VSAPGTEGPAEGRDRGDVRRRFADEARAARPDLATLCLLIAAEADPTLGEAGLDAAQVELDRLAGLLPYAAGGPEVWARATGDLLGRRCGFHGEPADYRRLESSLLPAVLRRRRGLPILLSVVWIEVARRAGAPVHGVARPGHFLVGFGDPGGAGGQVLADPFAGGALLPPEPGTGHVVAAGPLDVVRRILANIRAWAAERPERTDVALWAVELSMLLPSRPARLRYERAQLLVQRGDFLGGAAEMDEYAEVVAAVEPATAEAIRARARSARAMLN